MENQKKITREQLKDYHEKLKVHYDEIAAFLEDDGNWDQNGVIADDTVPPGNPPPNPPGH